MIKRHKQLVLTIVMLIPLLAVAEGQQQHNESLGAHVHGVSALAIVMEGNALEVQLHSPAINVLGFEHKASSPKEIAALESTVQKLKQAESFFTINGGQCKLVNQSIDVSSVLRKSEDEHHSHADEHAHEEVHEQHNSHSEIIADYGYHCKSISALSSITVSLFKAFPDIHEVQVMWIKETQQGAVTLNAEHNEITFR